MSGGGPSFDIVAYITMDEKRVIGGKQLSLLARSEEEMERLMAELARALRADVTRLSVGDYVLFRGS